MRTVSSVSQTHILQWNRANYLSILETFLPFEMEVTYGAALHLMMANTLFPHATDGQWFSEQAHSVFDEMIFKGNKLAAARKTELTHLEGLFQELAVRIERYGLQTLALTTPQNTEDGIEMAHLPTQQLQEPAADPTLHEHPQPDLHLHPGPAAVHSHQHADADAHVLQDPAPSSTLPHLANGVELLDEIGISSYEFLSIIEQIGKTDNSVLD